MIVHKIYKTEPPPVEPVRITTGFQPNFLHAHNQLDLTAVINGVGAKVGDFYCFTEQPVHTLACINVITHVEHDFRKVVKKYGIGTVAPYKLIQCDRWSPPAPVWIRWDDLKHMRCITENEFKKFVEPKLVDIQNNCEGHWQGGFNLVTEYTINRRAPWG